MAFSLNTNGSVYFVAGVLTKPSGPNFVLTGQFVRRGNAGAIATPFDDPGETGTAGSNQTTLLAQVQNTSKSARRQKPY
jgi:hypothetical protein